MSIPAIFSAIPLGCHTVAPPSANTPIPHALIFIVSSYERLTGYLPKAQRSRDVSEMVDRYRADAAPPDGFMDMDIERLQACLSEAVVNAATTAYQGLLEITQAHGTSAPGAQELTHSALLILATKSALICIKKGDEGAEAYAARLLAPRGLTLLSLPTSIQEKLWQIQSELQG